MLRRVILGCALSVATAASAVAGTIGPQAAGLPYGFMYSPSSSPFEAFEWTPLDFAAFSAYGGDFANVRKPVTPIYFFEEPIVPAQPQGPEDEQGAMLMMGMPFFEGMPSASEARMAFSMMAVPPDDPEENGVPEPGTLALIGLGLLGASARLRRSLKRANH